MHTINAYSYATSNTLNHYVDNDDEMKAIVPTQDPLIPLINDNDPLSRHKNEEIDNAETTNNQQ